MYSSLQEGGVDTLKTVGDLLVQTRDGLKATTGYTNKKTSYSYSSAAKAASKLVAVFPMLISKTVSSETATMMAKFIEQKGCIFLQMALQQANISDAKNGIEYLHQYHQNLNIGGGGADAVAKMVDAWVDGVVGESSQTLTGHLLEQSNPYDDSILFESDSDLQISSTDMKQLMEVFASIEGLEFYDMKLNPISISDYVVKEFEDGSYNVSLSVVTEAKKRAAAPVSVVTDSIDSILSTGKNIYDLGRKVQKDKQEDEDRRERKQREKEDREREEAERKAEEETRRRGGKNVVGLKDQDIKKANNAVPSLLVVRFYNSETTAVATEFIIGVKAKIVGCVSDEILRRIANDNKDGKKFLNLMRTITGELKASDFLFGLGSMSDDLKSTRRKGAQGDTWELLKTRAAAAQQRLKNHQNNDFAAITTVVISQEDANSLYKEENIDINDPKVALHFMKSYDLMGFAICDDSNESIKMIFDDGDDYFEEVAYRMLERETEGGTYKKLINLMAASR